MVSDSAALAWGTNGKRALGLPGRARLTSSSGDWGTRIRCPNSGKMRPLTEEETRVMFEKIAKYIGENLQLLVDRPDGTYCFRLHNDRVYYVSEKILKLAANIAGDKLVSLGTCFGKFTKTHKFRLHITALDYLAPYAKYKVWIKPGAEQSFLYGNHVLKSGLGRITENTSQYQGVVVYSMADIPLPSVRAY
ncbi:60S ribosome subunit biogenesis protein NIP7 homolog isoform X3 [Myotis daubentonii]|uniref:60S ribosome subunit biogenesis protein NIP7 homolog isoform X3 n=2 Tax=Myotis daubentonii TaxID=98922 RepID=UPI0028734463|nr:60S ribosome subunit biogenesis protein NIP7 homolog isoform X3 [Myotis daubentonii]